MSNKPVAWMMVNRENTSAYLTFEKPTRDMKISHEPTPLYTHPVKEYKEPSVKEIEDLWLDVVNNIPANDHRPREWYFAKAILRKAQEK